LIVPLSEVEPLLEVKSMDDLMRLAESRGLASDLARRLLANLRLFLRIVAEVARGEIPRLENVLRCGVPIIADGAAIVPPATEEEVSFAKLSAIRLDHVLSLAERLGAKVSSVFKSVLIELDTLDGGTSEYLVDLVESARRVAPRLWREAIEATARAAAESAYNVVTELRRVVMSLLDDAAVYIKKVRGVERIDGETLVAAYRLGLYRLGLELPVTVVRKVAGPCRVSTTVCVERKCVDLGTHLVSVAPQVDVPELLAVLESEIERLALDPWLRKNFGDYELVEMPTFPKMLVVRPLRSPVKAVVVARDLLAIVVEGRVGRENGVDIREMGPYTIAYGVGYVPKLMCILTKIARSLETVETSPRDRFVALLEILAWNSPRPEIKLAAEAMVRIVLSDLARDIDELEKVNCSETVDPSLCEATLLYLHTIAEPSRLRSLSPEKIARSIAGAPGWIVARVLEVMGAGARRVIEELIRSEGAPVIDLGIVVSAARESPIDAAAIAFAYLSGVYVPILRFIKGLEPVLNDGVATKIGGFIKLRSGALVYPIGYVARKGSVEDFLWLAGASAYPEWVAVVRAKTLREALDAAERIIVTPARERILAAGPPARFTGKEVREVVSEVRTKIGKNEVAYTIYGVITSREQA